MPTSDGDDLAVTVRIPLQALLCYRGLFEEIRGRFSPLIRAGRNWGLQNWLQHNPVTKALILQFALHTQPLHYDLDWLAGKVGRFHEKMESTLASFS